MGTCFGVNVILFPRVSTGVGSSCSLVPFSNNSCWPSSLRPSYFLLSFWCFLCVLNKLSILEYLSLRTCPQIICFCGAPNKSNEKILWWIDPLKTLLWTLIDPVMMFGALWAAIWEFTGVKKKQSDVGFISILVWEKRTGPVGTRRVSCSL